VIAKEESIIPTDDSSTFSDIKGGRK
jgi:hypothetical protein